MRKFFCLLVLSLAACQPANHQALPSAVAIPSVTTKPSLAPTLTPPPTPTVAQLMAPYTIDGLQHHQFQSGKITITSTVETTDAFTRYIISYPSDGLTITGVMQIPAKGHAPFPVIIMNHGYFDREGYVPGDGTYRAAEYLSQHGYITLASDYRSWGKSDIGPSFFYAGLAIDVINLMNAVPSIPQADPNRIGIWGHSNGGHIALATLAISGVTYPTVLWAPVSTSFPYSILYYTDQYDDNGKALRKLIAGFDAQASRE